LISIGAIIAAIVVARRYGELRVFEKQEEAATEALHLKQMKLLSMLLSSLEMLRETARHNAQRRGEFLEFQSGIWESAFFRVDSVLPFDESLADAVRTLLMQLEYANLQIRLCQTSRHSISVSKASIAQMCTVGAQANPYNLPSTMDLAEGHLKRVEQDL
jgi:hypothetical protein